MQEQENVQEVAEEVVATEEAKEPTTGSLLTDESDAQRIYGYVKEVIELFRPRVEAGELNEYQVAEILSIAMTGTIISTVPPQLMDVINRETDSLVNYMYKQYKGKVQKKNPTFGAQVLAPVRMASYLVSEANRTVDSIRSKVKAGATAKEAIASTAKE
ncbi:hypothetical protein D3C86_1357530 [compost metagenome]